MWLIFFIRSESLCQSIKLISKFWFYCSHIGNGITDIYLSISDMFMFVLSDLFLSMNFPWVGHIRVLLFSFVWQERYSKVYFGNCQLLFKQKQNLHKALANIILTFYICTFFISRQNIFAMWWLWCIMGYLINGTFISV
jgi:hypothetical protein